MIAENMRWKTNREEEEEGQEEGSRSICEGHMRRRPPDNRLVESLPMSRNIAEPLQGWSREALKQCALSGYVDCSAAVAVATCIRRHKPPAMCYR